MHAKIISLSIYFFYVVGSLKWGKKSLEWNNNNISSVFWIHLLTWEIKKWFIRNLWCTVSRHDFNYFQKACTLHLKNKLNFTAKKNHWNLKKAHNRLTSTVRSQKKILQHKQDFYWFFQNRFFGLSLILSFFTLVKEIF